MTLFHVAAYNGWSDEVAAFVNAGANVNERDDKGYSPLHWATFRAAVTDQTQVIRSLLAAGAELNALTKDGSSTPLIFAVASGAEDAVIVLIRAGADVDLAADGVTPLMVAARDGNSELAKLLIEAGAKSAKSCGEYCAADYADAGGHAKLASYLRGLA